jgi:hypothetical protein
MRYISAVIFLIAFSFAPLHAANGNGAGSALSEEELTNMKYDREFLIDKRDAFIEFNGDLPVTEIIIKGLKKTNREIILSETGIIPGDTLSAFDPHLFINRMKKKNIFTEIGINYIKGESGAIIEITVEEKWTLIPIPVVSSNRHGTSYGLYIMDSNFLGYGKYLFAGGTLSSDRGTAMIGYIDPSIAGSRFRGSLFLSYRNEVYQNAGMDYILYREYKAEKGTARLDLGYSITEKLKLFASGGYEQGSVDRGYNESLDMPDNEKAWLTGTIVKYEHLVHYEYLYYGPKLEVNCFRHIAAGEKYSGYATAAYKFDYSFRLIDYNRFSIASNGAKGSRPAIFEETLGGKPGGRTLPAEIVTADSYINYTITAEYPFLRYKWGAITLLAFWEHGMYENNSEGKQVYYGPGAGTMFYLRRIALPAMGFNIARNLESDSTEYSFSIGMSF